MGLGRVREPMVVSLEPYSSPLLGSFGRGKHLQCFSCLCLFKEIFPLKRGGEATMQVASNAARKLSRVLRAPIFLQQSERFLISDVEQSQNSSSSPWQQNQRSFSAGISDVSGITTGIRFPQNLGHHVFGRACYSSEASSSDEVPSDDVKEVYDKMLKSVEGETMPPNALLWSLIEKCSNKEDIKLLFQMLQNLRRFRLSNLRIHANFNSNLCTKVSAACTRVGALDFDEHDLFHNTLPGSCFSGSVNLHNCGKRTLWEHNVYGLTPSIASAHNLLSYAEEHKDAELMVDIMKLLKKNHMPLQPGTADYVFRICYHTDNWKLISKYSIKFIKAGVKLRRTAFNTWMEFAAKRGDVESLWKIEKLRSEMTKQHTVGSAFCCAKGFLLEHKPEDAATIIHILNKNLPEGKRSDIAEQLQKLVSEWPMEVLKHGNEEHGKEWASGIASSLKVDIPSMINHLINMGLEVSVNLEDLNRHEAILS